MQSTPKSHRMPPASLHAPRGSLQIARAFGGSLQAHVPHASPRVSLQAHVPSFAPPCASLQGPTCHHLHAHVHRCKPTCPNMHAHVPSLARPRALTCTPTYRIANPRASLACPCASLQALLRGVGHTQLDRADGKDRQKLLQDCIGQNCTESEEAWHACSRATAPGNPVKFPARLHCRHLRIPSNFLQDCIAGTS